MNAKKLETVSVVFRIYGLKAATGRRKEPLQAVIMRKLGNKPLNLDLKCDFPARESFREELLANLLVMDEREMHQAAPIGSTEHPESDPEIRELSDDELEMLAAAQGQPTIPPVWLDEALRR